MKKIIFIFIILLFSGCINKKGISLQYYDNCSEEYQLYGVYKYRCKDNIINFNSKKTKKQIGNFITKDCLGCN